MAKIGRPEFQHRDKVLSDLLEFELSLDEIAMRYDISRRTVYVIADENNLDMSIRTKLIRLVEERNRIQNQIDRLSSSWRG